MTFAAQVAHLSVQPSSCQMWSMYFDFYLQWWNSLLSLRYREASKWFSWAYFLEGQGTLASPQLKLYVTCCNLHAGGPHITSVPMQGDWGRERVWEEATLSVRSAKKLKTRGYHFLCRFGQARSWFRGLCERRAQRDRNASAELCIWIQNLLYEVAYYGFSGFNLP